MKRRSFFHEALEAVATAIFYCIVALGAMCLFMQNAGCVEPSWEYDFESEGGSVALPPSVVPPLDIGFEQDWLPYKLDLPQQVGCSYLDLLFVVDNSSSMYDEQDQMLSAVPGFIDRLRDFGIGIDLHIGVTPTDTRNGCGGLGAIINGEYLTWHELERFPEMFLVGTHGSGYERVAEAMIDALKPADSDDPFGARDDDCNVGFHRPDTGLVIVLLTDEPDTAQYGSDGSAEKWASQLEYLHPGELLVVGFIPQLGCGWHLDTQVGTRLNRFLDMVPSYPASICADDYAAEFAEATEALVAQCGAVPPES